MKRFYFFGLAFVLPLFFSCNTKTLEDARLERLSLDSIPQTALEMEVIAEPFEWGDVSTPDLYLAGDSLVALSYFKNAAVLRFYDLTGKDLGKSSIRKLTDRHPLAIDPAYRASFSFLHPNTNIFYEYTVEDGALRLDNFTRMRLYGNSPRQAVRLDADHFAFIGSYKDGLWGIWEESTRELTFTGTYPITYEIVPQALLPYFSGRIAFSGDQLVYVSYQFGYISSYRYKKGKLRKLWEKQVSDFLYRESSLGYTFDEKHKNGFLEVAFAGDHIYTLYNGCDDSAGEEFTNAIVVFTREGRPVARYTLPDMMSYMKFDSKGEYAYATYSKVGSTQVLVRFRLPGI
ncbi:hypothetical protein [Parabacteroides sp. PF5-6]|uniref:hypothetical protein n=1 Tax=Parabacteroides sp. PF5-6 TaxID=1742403 RepID=UPI0024076F00|nr:hypothetical protein [Parabacteroides sp. PF5-6]MDF9830536.1 hypothetical protein [Parabacteroides sp. PF5-6]